jgi:LPXTG-motif cell wall-anchored protein
LDATGTSNGITGAGSLGSCEAPGSAVDAAAASGDASGSVFVGCVAGSVSGSDTTGATSAGVCRAAGTTPGPGETPGDEGDADDGTGAAAGEAASGNTSPQGVLAAAAAGELPYTGLPVWAVTLAGLFLAGLGVLFRRRRPEIAGAL